MLTDIDEVGDVKGLELHGIRTDVIVESRARELKEWRLCSSVLLKVKI